MKGLKKEVFSFFHALQGIIFLIVRERHARFHFLATIAAIFLGFYLNISVSEWLWIVLAISLVLAAESFNTSIEKLADLVQPEMDPRVKYIKDLAAGAVLLLSLAAAIIGLIIFVPHI